jgi:hypothetical protein
MSRTGDEGTTGRKWLVDDESVGDNVPYSLLILANLHMPSLRQDAIIRLRLQNHFTQYRNQAPSCFNGIILLE